MAQTIDRRDVLRGATAGLIAAGAVRSASAETPIVPGQPGLVLTPGPAGSWDSERVSCPRVIREADGRWKMWYYGRDPSFDRMVGLPCGRSGLATSADGIHWTRVRGPGTMGSVMDPSAEPGRFDSVFVGVSDVRRTARGYEMAYFGGGDTIATIRGRVTKGFPVRPGRAFSRDGLHWTRENGPVLGAVLDVGPPGAFDADIVGWPQIMQGKDGGWRLYYHSVSPQFGFAIGMATSTDEGKTWQKVGPILTKSADADAFDSIGPGTRHVFLSGGRYVMLYEGVSLKGKVNIGLATSDDGEHWKKEKGPLPGGAVFPSSTPGATPEQSPWDSLNVGTPWVVALPDGGHRLYYIGNKAPPAGVPVSELTVTHQIGMAVAEGGDFTRWHRWGA